MRTVRCCARRAIDSGSMTVHESNRRRLKAKGWRIGTVKEFLNLTRAESARIERRLKPAEPSKKPRRSSPS